MKPKLGSHMSPPVVTSRLEEIRDKFSLIQIFLGRNISFRINSEIGEFLKRYTPIFDVYGHSPYIINLCNVNHDMFDKSVTYLRTVAELGQQGLKGYVTHLGKIFTKEQYESGEYQSTVFGNDSLTKALDLLVPYFERNNMVLLLENSAGNDFGSDLATVGYLMQKIREYNSPHLKICWDTEHSYACNGPSVETVKSLVGLKREIGMIHLNAIEKGVEKGNHKDRHSYTTFETCTKFPAQTYVDFVNTLPDIPMVFERDNLDLALTDYNFITSKLDA